MIMDNLYICIRKLAIAFGMMALLSTSAINAELLDEARVFEIRPVEEQQFSRADNCLSYFEGTTEAESCREGEVPIPAASWLFLLVLIAFVGLSNKKKL